MSLLSTLRWRHNGRDSISNHQPHDCFLNRLFSRGSKEISKLCVTGFCAGNSPGTGEFPAQMASNAEKKFPFDDVIMFFWVRCGETILAATPSLCLAVVGTRVVPYKQLPHYGWVIGSVSSDCKEMVGRSGIILCMHTVNVRRRCIVTPSLICWAHTQNDPWGFKPQSTTRAC